MFDESWFVDVSIDTAMDRLLQRQVLGPHLNLPVIHCLATLSSAAELVWLTLLWI